MHGRLTTLGLPPSVDATDDFGDATAAVVEAFQRSRGLPITGEVDATTWSRLVEAGWQMGQRLLYLTRPFLRGDDVAEVQVRLAQLGFNSGRIDGIFGYLLEGALREFQSNCGLETTGVLTRATLHELLRMSATTSERSLVNDARDLAGFNEAATGPVVICGDRALMGPLARLLGPAFSVVELEDANAEQVATYANANEAALVISLQHLGGISGIHLHYWASYRSHSRQGERLASAIAAAFSHQSTLPRVEVTGMALPILRETRMITLHIEHDTHPEQEIHEIVTVIARIVSEFIHR